MTGVQRPPAEPGREVVVRVATSYPRFPGDTIGTFMEPIARGIAARGHDVHMVIPWHPRLARDRVEFGVRFHPFRYAPAHSLYVFGYAGALRADVNLRLSAYAVAPLALAAGWRKARKIARKFGATVVHGHWVIPGGAIAAAACPGLPLVVSLHGSDVYVAERNPIARRVARSVFQRAGWVTACSEDLRTRAFALGAAPGRSETIPYGVDADRFRPNAEARSRVRGQLGVPDDAPLLFTAGRFVRKKGFEYLIDAVARLAPAWPALRLAIGGAGDLDAELRERAARHLVGDRVIFPGVLSQDAVADYLAAADLAVVPSVRDDAGNVDGLPNVVMEALASGTALVATTAGGIASVAHDDVNAALVAERDVDGLARTIDRLLGAPDARARLGARAREDAVREHSWARVAEAFERAYLRAREHRVSPGASSMKGRDSGPSR
jgi:glycosyltransferase involved in cell wall biosynthesis